MELGKKIRTLREAQGMTLKQLSDLVDVSVSMISQIERGHTNPSVGLLKQIANNLNIPIACLFSDDEDNSVIVRRGERKRIVYGKNEVIHELLAPVKDRKIEFLYNIFNPGSSTSMIVHEGEECGFILQGEAEVLTDDKVYILREGDSIYLNSTIPHCYTNRHESIPLIMVSAITPPTY